MVQNGTQCLGLGQIRGLKKEEVPGEWENRVRSVFVTCAPPQALFE